jgi:hypothetical protein
MSSRFDVPDDDECRAGVYANNASVTYSAYEFTLDFAVSTDAEISDPDDPSAEVTIPYRVVARVRLPVGLVFDLIRAINASMSGYEAIWGEIRRPTLEGGEE